jgi:predicted nucleic acid-binding protein
VTAFVLDNSIAMRWCFDTGAHACADRVLKQLEATGGEAVVPILWRYEVSSVLARAQNSGMLTSQRVAEFLEDLQALNIIIDTESSNRILTDVHQLAVTYHLTTYDAAYLELALRRDIPLATLDTELRQASLAAGLTILA